MTHPTIQKAREGAARCIDEIMSAYPDRGAVKMAVADISDALDLAERLQAEKDQGGFTGINAVMNQKLLEANETIVGLQQDNERLVKERDEALCKLIAAGAEKPNAEDMDWAFSLAARLQREERQALADLNAESQRLNLE